MKKVIVIPARYGSTRLPGKPLAMIGNKTMLERVTQVALDAAAGMSNTEVIIATDDDRIVEHANNVLPNVKTLKTSISCPTGTDRAFDAISQLDERPDVIINLQGDAPLTPPHFIRQLLECFDNRSVEVATVVTQLSWEKLEALRAHKKTSPFSGTTAVLNGKKQAMWFSKNILPAIRKENRTEMLSPVHRHIGLYGYRYNALKNFLTWPEGVYEKLEGLEQLRFLENDVSIQTTIVDYQGLPEMTGVDTPEDLVIAAKLIQEKERHAS